MTTERDGDEVVLTWRESGGPAVAPEAGAAGFGSQLMELAGVRQLGGTVTRDWRPAGLVVTVRAAVSAFSRH